MGARNGARHNVKRRQSAFGTNTALNGVLYLLQAGNHLPPADTDRA